MNLDIRRGILVCALGLPIFFGLRVAMEWLLGREIDYRHDLVWSSIMALVFGIFGLFEKDETE
jgi:hypothetical protein